MKNEIGLPIDSSKIIKELTAGSKLFGLQTLESDTDKYILYVDHESRLFPSSKLNFKVQSDDLSLEVNVIELGEFIKGCLRYNPSLRELEILNYLYSATSTPSYWVHDMVSVLKENPNIIRLGYYREIQRRYNKLFTRVHNKTGKNFNAQQMYDTKFAAHLYRVVKSLEAWNKDEQSLPPFYFGDIRTTYFAIKSGQTTSEDFKDLIDSLINAHAPEYSAILSQVQIQDDDFALEAKKIYWSAVRYYDR